MSDIEKGDLVVLLDRPLGHVSKIKGVVIGIVDENIYNILLTNGYGKGNIKRLRTFEFEKESEYVEVQTRKD